MKLNNKNDLSTIHSNLSALLSGLGIEGIAAEVGQCTYDGTGSNATFKVIFSRVGDDGIVETPEATAFKQLSKEYGVPAEALNTDVNINGKVVTLVGLKPRSSKYPFLGRRTDGSVYKYRGDTVERAVANR
jgi:hypothetical protein